MVLGRIREYLLPGAAELDPNFRREVERLSHLGLRVIGVIEIFMPMLLMAFQVTLMPEPSPAGWLTWRITVLILLGIATSLVARTGWSRPRARLLAVISGWLSAAVLVSSSLMVAEDVSWAGRHIPTMILAVLLVGVAAIPLRPLQTLALGLSIEGFYALASVIAWRWNALPEASQDPFHHAMVTVMTLLCTALTALIYRERVAEHRAHQEALRAYDDLCKARARAALSENAASLARMVAAFSHELNTPVGALRSAVDTLLVLSARQATCPPSEQQRLLTLQADLRKSLSNSVDRLRAIVGRMQRLTNLDKTELQEANLNELLGDVAALLEPQTRGRVRLELRFQPLPPLICRPQQLSAVFSNLLSNALDAIESEGKVVISTERVDLRVEIRIADNGRGMDPDQLAAVFDPGFRVAAGRVSTGHWSLFGARQIVREHGGEINISSTQGKGTTVKITLPIGMRPAA